MHISFNIDHWRAWVPTEDNTQPDVSVIPSLLRRRLSPLARAAISVIMPLVDQYGAMPLVYVSRHGDLSRTLGLLEDVAKGEPLSPTAFSLSVHNATSGLFSIHQGLTKNITAISGGLEDLVPGLLESLGQCNELEPRVLCVFCDEPPPAIYIKQTTQPKHGFALAFVVSRGDGWVLKTVADYQKADNNNLPQSLQLLAVLEDNADTMSFRCNGTAWQLNRCHL